MIQGIYISNELITFFYSDDAPDRNDKVHFRGLSGEGVDYLYFTYDKNADFPLLLNSEARQDYFPGNKEIVGDIFKFIGNKNDKFLVFDKTIGRFEVIDRAVSELISANTKFLENQKKEFINEPFYLLLPPYTNDKIQKNLTKTAGKFFKDVRTFHYDLPCLHNLIDVGEIKVPAKTLYLEKHGQDVFFNLFELKGDNRNVNIIQKSADEVKDTGLDDKVLKAVSEELITNAILQFVPDKFNDEQIKEVEIIKNIPVAQDILNEVSDLENWTSAEARVDLPGGKGGQVMIHRQEIALKIEKIMVETGIDKKLQSLISSFKPASIVLAGDYLCNTIFSGKLKELENIKTILSREDFYKNTVETFVSKIHVFDKKAKVKTKTVEPAFTEVSSPAPAIHSSSASTIKPKPEQVKSKSRVWIAIVVPVIVLAGILLIYKFYFNKKEVAFEEKEKVPVKEIHEVNQNTIQFSAFAGDTQSLQINSTVPWRIDSIPDWLAAGQSSGDSAANLSVFTILENKISEPRKFNLDIVFNNADTQSVVITQAGLRIDSTLLTEKTPAKEKLETDKEPVKISKPEIKAVKIPGLDTLFRLKSWDFKELNAYFNGIRNQPVKISYDNLYKFIDPKCEVFYYVNGEKLSSQDFTAFVNKIKLGGTEKVVPNSLKFDDSGKIIEFGQE